MAEEPLLTLKQLAAELGLPESTVRYYRDAYIDQVPSIGTGRRRRYPPQAVAVLRSIAASYASGGSRSEVIAGITPARHLPVVGASTESHQSTLEHVTNLDLLAAILDGEREQRDALWQMAKEIVRITEVLTEQDQVLGEIADRAGVVVAGRLPAPRPAAALKAGTGTTGTDDRGPRTEKAALIVSSVPEVTVPGPRSSVPEVTVPVPTVPDSSMAQLREELNAERQLVERLRHAKLQLEHRTAEAEAALGQGQKGRRSNVLGRLLGRTPEE